MSEEEAARIAAAADEHRKADYDLVMELKDTDGNVVAISTNRYQMRSTASDRAPHAGRTSRNWTNVWSPRPCPD